MSARIKSTFQLEGNVQALETRMPKHVIGLTDYVQSDVFLNLPHPVSIYRVYLYCYHHLSRVWGHPFRLDDGTRPHLVCCFAEPVLFLTPGTAVKAHCKSVKSCGRPSCKYRVRLASLAASFNEPAYAETKYRQFRTIEDTKEKAPSDAGSGWVVCYDCYHNVGISVALVSVLMFTGLI